MDTSAEKSRYSYSHAHYEANDEGYQNDDDERLYIDNHGWSPFSSDPDVSVKEQSINLTDTLQSVDNIVLNAYLRFIGIS